ncbi:MAG: D-alanine--D-alanine ligase [Weeksellaceae bacterium]|nr:D-alanine--D-alanine ligase [Weeksellaceae bacterium]
MKATFIKWTKYEFWPFWLFYGPLTPWYIYKIFTAGAPAYFCTANPGFKWGGFINYSKFDILKQIDRKFLPKTIFFTEISSAEIPMKFPFIAKPDEGERGIAVELIRDEKDWNNYLKQNNKNLIIQEFNEFPLEFGAFYVRLPKEKKGKLISMTGKDFLQFTGDGKSTFRELIDQNIRALFRKDYLVERYKNQLDEILPKGESILVEPIGNHNRGTTFLDASDLISPELENQIDKIAQSINGFYYGRFDIKAKTIEDLQNGNFVILEVNGANSEATHVYDPKHNLFFAYKEVIRHLNYQHKIAKQNHQLGHQYIKWPTLALELMNRGREK